MSWVREKLSFASVMASIAVFMALGGSAWAVSNGASLTLFGTVRADGTTFIRSDIKRVTHSTTGIYNVQFTRSLSGCGMVGSNRGGLPGFSSVTVVPSRPTIAVVRTFDVQGSLFDRAFDVVAHCP